MDKNEVYLWLIMSLNSGGREDATKIPGIAEFQIGQMEGRGLAPWVSDVDNQKKRQKFLGETDRPSRRR